MKDYDKEVTLTWGDWGLLILFFLIVAGLIIYK